MPLRAGSLCTCLSCASIPPAASLTDCCRLWFELTEAVFAFVSNDANSSGDNFVQVKSCSCPSLAPTGARAMWRCAWCDDPSYSCVCVCAFCFSICPLTRSLPWYGLRMKSQSSSSSPPCLTCARCCAGPCDCAVFHFAALLASAALHQLCLRVCGQHQPVAVGADLRRCGAAEVPERHSRRSVSCLRGAVRCGALVSVTRVVCVLLFLCFFFAREHPY